MSKDYFDPFSFTKSLVPSTVGFDSIFKSFEDMHRTMSKATINSYPPYNIKKVADNKYVVELAVAGFGKQDIDVELNKNTLVIKGSTTLDTLTKDGTDVTYLHKGIAERAFTRSFQLADTIEIKNAELINGILKIWLEALVPNDKSRKIDIKDESTRNAKLSEYDKEDSQFLTEGYSYR